MILIVEISSEPIKSIIFWRMFRINCSIMDIKFCNLLILELSNHYNVVKWKWKLLCHIWLFATPGIVLEFSRPEYWSGQPFPSPGDLPNPGIEPRSPALQVDSSPAEPPGKPKWLLLPFTVKWKWQLLQSVYACH